MVTLFLPKIDCAGRAIVWPGWSRLLSGGFGWLLAVLFLSACASSPVSPGKAGRAALYVPQSNPSLIARLAPEILVDEPQLPYNRPGTPELFLDGAGQFRARVNPDQPALFVQEQFFQGRCGQYRNLIYRVHFSEVPPRHLTAGLNPGLLIIITLDSGERPLLYTLVHTCGCYLAMIPTSHLPVPWYPEGWNAAGQRVYGEILPGLIALPVDGGMAPVRITLRTGTHRVRSVTLSAPLAVEKISMPIKPMELLRSLPAQGSGQIASFFHESGSGKGYVRDSDKLWEQLLLIPFLNQTCYDNLT